MQPNSHIKDILNKFVLNQCNKEEIEEVISYIQDITESDQIPSVEDVLELLEEKVIMPEEIASQIHNNILQIDKENIKISKRTVPFWSYTAAALLIGVLSINYFFREDNLIKPLETLPVLVSKPIQPGSDKATLTLEDGSVVALEKGESINISRASSNGEQIIYKDEAINLSKVAYNYLTIPRGGQFNVKLSDGTVVWLNSESKLKYPIAFVEGETRQVELVYGEAYFDVSPSTKHKGAKFIVISQSQEIEVLGTEFNVKAYKDETSIYTTLVEGKVIVNTSLSNDVLTPSEQLKLNIQDNTISVSNVDVYSEISWKEGVFSFKEKPLKDIMKVISRWYDVNVIFENKELELLKFNGVLDKERSVEKVLSIMKSTTINNYEIDNKTIRLF